jgi:hypothetical protein
LKLFILSHLCFQCVTSSFAIYNSSIGIVTIVAATVGQAHIPGKFADIQKHCFSVVVIGLAAGGCSWVIGASAYFHGGKNAFRQSKFFTLILLVACSYSPLQTVLKVFFISSWVTLGLVLFWLISGRIASNMFFFDFDELIFQDRRYSSIS